MYNVSVTNNYSQALIVDNKPQTPTNVIPANGTSNFTNWGSHFIEIPGMGSINFIDLAEQKLSDYTNPSLPWTEYTWGGLIRYKSLDGYFRYEGQGEVVVEVDQFGSVNLTFAQGGMLVSIPDLTVSQATS